MKNVNYDNKSASFKRHLDSYKNRRDSYKRSMLSKEVQNRMRTKESSSERNNLISLKAANSIERRHKMHDHKAIGVRDPPSIFKPVSSLIGDSSTLSHPNLHTHQYILKDESSIQILNSDSPGEVLIVSKIKNRQSCTNKPRNLNFDEWKAKFKESQAQKIQQRNNNFIKNNIYSYSSRGKEFSLENQQRARVNSTFKNVELLTTQRKQRQLRNKIKAKLDVESFTNIIDSWNTK